MRKIIIAVMVMVIFMGSSGWAGTHAGEKFGRGVFNIVTSPVEVVKQTRSYWIQGSEKTFHISAWLFCGFVKGVVMTIARIGSGVWDIITFPAPLPANFQPLLKPASVFEDWPHRQPGVVYKQLGQT